MSLGSGEITKLDTASVSSVLIIDTTDCKCVWGNFFGNQNISIVYEQVKNINLRSYNH